MGKKLEKLRGLANAGGNGIQMAIGTVIVFGAFVGLGIAQGAYNLKERIFPGSNGVNPDLSGQDPFLKGLEKDVVIPAPTEEDIRWSKKFRAAHSGEISEALQEAIGEGKNWRVQFLINRPARGSLMPYSHATYGFNSGSGFAYFDAWVTALKNDNVTAGYLLMKESQAAKKGDKHAKEAMQCNAINMLRSAASTQSSRNVLLLVNIAGSLDKDDRVLQSYLQESVLAAVQKGRFDYLDLFKERGMTDDLLKSAYADASFNGIFSSTGPLLSAKQRESFLGWMKRAGVADETFVAKAAELEAAETARISTIATAERAGWSCHISDALGKDPRATRDDSWVSAAVRQNDPASGQTLVVLFNYEAGRVKVYEETGPRAQPVRVMPIEEYPDRALAEQGHGFLAAQKSGRAPKPLPWKTGSV